MEIPQKIDLSSIVLCIAAYWVVQLFDSSTDNTQNLPVVVSRLESIEKQMTKITERFDTVRTDPFTGKMGREMQTDFSRQLGELHGRISNLETHSTINQSNYRNESIK